MAISRLDTIALAQALKEMPGWELREDGLAITRSFRFENFRQAFAFMAECALWAEKLDHHPEWFNVYSRVEVTLTTHDAKGVTEKDLRLAKAMNGAASKG